MLKYINVRSLSTDVEFTSIYCILLKDTFNIHTFCVELSIGSIIKVGYCIQVLDFYLVLHGL